MIALPRARTLGSPEENLCARISRPSSIGVLEHTLSPVREPRIENSHIEESIVGDSQGQKATSYGAKYAGNKADYQNAVTGEREDRGVAASGPKRSPIRQSCRIPCHPQTNIGEPKRIRPVSENSHIREPGLQKTTTTKNTLCRTPYIRESSNKDYESEGYPTLTFKPIDESNERLAKRCVHLPRVETTAGCTSALADGTTREQLNSLQRPPDGSFLSTAGEAQETFGRGILRFQPHGPRNAYVITFLPDVMSWEKPPHSTSHGRANQLSAPVADCVLGAQNNLPIDPLILADDGPWEAGDVDQPFSMSDDPNPSETIFLYPNPPPLFSNALGQRDSVVLGHAKEAQSISSPHDRRSVAAANLSSGSPLSPARSGKQSKPRKRKLRRPDGPPPKRVRGSHTSVAEGNSVQFLPWLLEGALPYHMLRLDPLTTGNGDAWPVSPLTQRSNSSEPHGSSRKGLPWSSEEKGLVLRLRRDEKRPWSEVTRLISGQFPGRSRGSIQVFWSTTLKREL
ncbi:hypothetical protein BDV24DRAFT_171386 [Aspergillus arachidicola]|uniref:Myb-like domain-containing protein n=1 Tax=Aspergillus arachidicola TaxID=656916 RepID=A0A5N6YHH3_9EURO|nr:hypothetical protein BDV24DRAFT_171386 [Aspergillus arachidicola]